MSEACEKYLKGSPPLKRSDLDFLERGGHRITAKPQEVHFV